MRTVIDSQAAQALAPETARRRRQQAAAKFRPDLEVAVRGLLHKTFGRKNGKLRYNRLTPREHPETGEVLTFKDEDGGEHVVQDARAAIDDKYALADLDARPKRRRISRVGAFRPLSSRTDKDFVDAILGGVLSAWIYRKRRDPSQLSVAEAIAARLGVEAEARFAVGLDLLQLAIDAGVVEERKRWNKKLTRSWITIVLTEEVAAALCKLEDSEPWPWPATGIHAGRITASIGTKQSSRQVETPHQAAAGTAPLAAAERIQNTKWRVNPQMLREAGGWLQDCIDEIANPPEQEDPFEPGKTYQPYGSYRKAASVYTAELAAYRAITEKGATQCGNLAVRYDHRGRVNQVDSILTYTSGCEISRGILEFDESRRVETEAGRLALARHILNHWDAAKSRRVPRGSEVEWVEAHPLIELEWRRAKHPLRFLAAAHAWTAVQHGDPIRLPVSIDATTSVLQHMALLLRDPQLAQVSNLWPNKRQRDFYGEIAEQLALPEDLKSKGRDMVKKIIMPTFYGKSDWTSHYDLAADFKIPKTLRRRIYPAMMKAARDLAPRAFGLYDALVIVAKELAVRNEPVRWRTVSSWEGCTARRQQVLEPVDRKLGNGVRIQRDRKVNGAKLDPLAQADAVTANLVHSLDATLLHLAVRGLPESVTSIAVAHDCFAVHADDVPALRATLMQTLGQMYREDVLGAWWTGWNTSVPCPERGTWDDRFLDGEYTFC